MTMPIPRPSHSASIEVCHSSLSIDSRESITSPNVMMAVPATGNSL
jgi:hypothetical protein